MTYKVLVVDDSALMRLELTKIIEKDGDLQVIGTSKNGAGVLDKIRKLSPDVVTLDIQMPVKDGLEVLQEVMSSAPLPIVMVSALTQEGARETLEALELGAFDFVPKPSGAISLDLEVQGDIIRKKLIIAAKNGGNLGTKIKRRPQANLGQSSSSLNSQSSLCEKALIGLGVSTGGPQILSSILPSIPGNFKGSFIIAIHMPEGFTASFAARLNKTCSIPVKEARHLEKIEKGMIYILPGGKQTCIDRISKGLVFKVSEEPRGDLSKPSIQLFFDSLTASCSHTWIGVMMTGMGTDGAEALTRHRKSGGVTLVESEKSSTVFTLPGKVIELGGAQYVLPASELIPKIMELGNRSVCL